MVNLRATAEKGKIDIFYHKKICHKHLIYKKFALHLQPKTR